MSVMVVFLRQDGAADVDGWARLSVDGRVMAQGDGAPVARQSGIRVIGIVPGLGIGLRLAELGSGTARQRLAAARLWAADHVAGDVQALHIAAQPVANDGGLCWIAWADGARIQSCIDGLAALGLVPEQLLPAASLLGADDAGTRTAHWRSFVLVRDTGGAAALTRSQAERLLDRANDIAPLTQADSDMHLLAGVVAGHGVNLLCGPLAPRHESVLNRSVLRRWAMLGAAAAALGLAGLLIDGWRHKRAADQLEAANIALVQAALPDARRIVNPRAQLREALLAANAVAADASAHISAVTRALAQQQDFVLTTLRYDRAGELSGTMLGGVDADPLRLRQMLEQSGWSLTLSPPRQGPAGMELDFSMRLAS